MLTPDQIDELKKQLSQQIQHLPDAEREEAQDQINEMSPEALEDMLKQQRSSQKSIMRKIIDGEIPSRKIDENKACIAVLEIRPITKGHVLIIPKQKAQTTNALPPQALTLAKKTTKRIILKLKAKNAEIQTENKFGEQVLNIIPVYDKPITLLSPRYEASEKELNEVHSLLKVTKRKPSVKKKKIQTLSPSSSIIKLKRKIP